MRLRHALPQFGQWRASAKTQAGSKQRGARFKLLSRAIKRLQARGKRRAARQHQGRVQALHDGRVKRIGGQRQRRVGHGCSVFGVVETRFGNDCQQQQGGSTAGPQATRQRMVDLGRNGAVPRPMRLVQHVGRDAADGAAGQVVR